MKLLIHYNALLQYVKSLSYIEYINQYVLSRFITTVCQ